MLKGISEVVNILLMSGCFSVDVRDVNDKTPLHYAALNGADEVFQMLVEEKADIDALDAVGATPLHFAVRSDSYLMKNLQLIIHTNSDGAVKVLSSLF